MPKPTNYLYCEHCGHYSPVTSKVMKLFRCKRMEKDYSLHAVTRFLKSHGVNKSASTLSYYETGKLEPNLTTLLAMAKIYDIPEAKIWKLLKEESAYEIPRKT